MKQFAESGQIPSELATRIVIGEDPLTAIGLGNKSFEGMTDIEQGLPVIEEAFKKLVPEEQQHQVIEQENKVNQELEIFKKKFEETVNVVKSNKDISLKPILVEMVTEYLKILGGPSEEISTGRQAMPQGRVRFERESGEMVIKTHKEFLQQK